MLCSTTQSRYIKTDIGMPVGRDESINYFDPDVDPLAGEDVSAFDKLGQEAKGININMPPPSPRLNPYLPDNIAKIGPWIPFKKKREGSQINISLDTTSSSQPRNG
jgi:hypothetical protein